MTKKFTHIKSIKILIDLNVKLSTIFVQRLIHLRKIIVILSYIKTFIFIHNVNLSINKNFLFESNDNFELKIYVHIINVFIIIILIRNDKNVSIKIFKNYRLRRIFEINFFNTFYIQNDKNVRCLIIKKSKFIHKINRFKKLISICVVTYVVVAIIFFDASIIFIVILIIFIVTLIIFIVTSIEMNLRNLFTSIFNFSKIVFLNDVIIYRSNVTNFFVKIIQNFSTL